MAAPHTRQQAVRSGTYVLIICTPQRHESSPRMIAERSHKIDQVRRNEHTTNEATAHTQAPRAFLRPSVDLHRPALGDLLGHIPDNTSTPTIDKGVRQEAKDFLSRAFASGSASIPSCTVKGEE